ncbi:Vesicle-associated membrane protein 9 [Apodemus speciosus]|uniref:Vesicle-associated membrane protein 9 n=1 Tax=Apodemus speciosus TaxID=105296 RepID=A0ABQ0ESK6_APOSI
MTITYSCVANGRAVLAELALTGGSYQEAAAKVLRQALLKAEPTTIIQIGRYNGLDSMAPSAFLRKMEYNRNRSSSVLSVVKSQVSDVRGVMLRNMDTVLERDTEAVSILTEETDDGQAAVHTRKQKRPPAVLPYHPPPAPGRQGPP